MSDTRARGNRPPPTAAEMEAERICDEIEVLNQRLLAAGGWSAADLTPEVIAQSWMATAAAVIEARTGRKVRPPGGTAAPQNRAHPTQTVVFAGGTTYRDDEARALAPRLRASAARSSFARPRGGATSESPRERRIRAAYRQRPMAMLAAYRRAKEEGQAR